MRKTLTFLALVLPFVIMAQTSTKPAGTGTQAAPHQISTSNTIAIAGWDYGNGKVMYCGMGYMMSYNSYTMSDLFKQNGAQNLFVNMVKKTSNIANPKVAIFDVVGTLPTTVNSDSLIAILGRNGITAVKVTSAMIDTDEKINTYNVLVLGGNGVYSDLNTSGYLTVQSVVQNFVQNNHGGAIFTGWALDNLTYIGATIYLSMMPVTLSETFFKNGYSLVKNLPDDPLFMGVGNVSSNTLCEYGTTLKDGAVAYATLTTYAISINSPVVSTASITVYDQTSATMGGNVTSDEGATVTASGVVYSTTDPTPTIAEGATSIAIASGTGAFSQSVNSLTSGTLYYVNSYAINSVGTSYGTPTSFTTNGTPTSVEANPDQTLYISFEPGKDKLKVTGFEGMADITLTAINGKQLFTKTMTNGESISINALPQGLYLAKIITKKGTTTKKIMK